MIEISLLGLALLAGGVALSTAAAWFASASLPWSHAAWRAGMPITVGLALAPFLFSLGGLFVLAVLPGASHTTHLLSALALFALLALAGWAAARQHQRPSASHPPLTFHEWFLIGALLLVSTALVLIATLTPLTQNDSLEYATVGRILFETRTLASYPVLDPDVNSAGFFGPWTHPPLYVAAIYLVEVIQGHADAPGAIRLISPWFLLTAAGVVYSIGALVQREIGLASSLIFLSTPLLFLGAATALLDALYVSALALLVAVICSIDARPYVRGAIVGTVIGLGLWTHSVAILYLPIGLAGLVLYRGLSQPRALAQELFLAISFALLIGGWHYWHNITLFGTPISDNPVVFALPSLHWDDYFVINRGLGTTVAMIQYGVLKGWFAAEAFGLTYWGLAAGFALLLLTSGFLPFVRSIWSGTARLGSIGVLYFVFSLMLVYLGGTVLSVVLGLDIMVKNERYLLSVQALVAIAAGYGYVTLIGVVSRLARSDYPRGVLNGVGYAALALVLVGQSLIFAQHAFGKGEIGLTSFGESFADKLSQVPEYQLTNYLRDSTPPGALVLTLKPADMYYSGRKAVSYLDERLVSFYEADDSASAYQRLKALGIGFVHVPNYGLPPLYNSALWEILADPALSTLVFSTAGGQIYALDAPPEETALICDAEARAVTPGVWPWKRQSVIRVGGRKDLAGVSLEGGEDLGTEASELLLPFGLFQRNIVTYLQSGIIPLDDADSPKKGREMAVGVALEGRGHFTLGIREFRRRGDGSTELVRETKGGSFELSQKQPTRRYGRRFDLDRQTDEVEVVIEQFGQSTLRITDATARECRSL
ncbi:MAG TPA: hypothetical protein PK271_03935 [Hyphomicrobium sp.]|uniref:ArnT family glycosyltransferase n=1 Tax=Hyphomicrobium sp. TaxID=82 RepID=UPI002C103429|nr:hypothetical protein [Hyphomicrobium sp.]HRN87730.1 hypothetical protein [Hyphomicrobium sp.]